MALHHRDGRRLEEPGEWVEEQLRLMGQWSLPVVERDLDANDRVHVWIVFFAKWAREICDDKGVDVDTFEPIFEEFENRVTPHIETLKYAMSARARRDVGLEEACRLIQGKAEELIRNGYRYLRFSMTFPHIGERKTNHTESAIFPIIDAKAAER